MLQKIHTVWLTSAENYINTSLLLRLSIPQQPMVTAVKKSPFISLSYFQITQLNKF